MERRNFLRSASISAGLLGTANIMGAATYKPSKQKTIVWQYDALAHGCVGDGITKNTQALQKIIDEATANGGGIITFPPGVYIIGTVFLKSNITLQIAAGATLKASPDRNDFVKVKNPKGDKGHDTHLLFAENAENIIICGGGTIDGNVFSFVEKPSEPGVWYGAEGAPHPMMKFDNVSNFRIKDILITRTTGWTCNFYCSQHIWIEGVGVDNDLFTGGSDGFDLNGCRDVMISNCSISTGDDCIAIKTTKTARSSERITITNCIFRTNCAAFRIGAETWHDIRNVVFSNSVVVQSSRGVDIAMMDGAVCEDINVNNICIDTDCGITLNRGIHFELRKSRGQWGGNTQADVGKMRRINISNITLKTDGRILLTAADGGMLENVTLRDIHMKFPFIEDPELVKDKSDKGQSSYYNPEARVARAAVVAENMSNFYLENLSIQWPEPGVTPNLLPKIEHGELVIDPAKVKRLPDFSVLWANNVVQSVVDIPFAEQSNPEIEKIVMKNSSILIR